MRVTVLQMQSGTDKAQNLREARRLCAEAVAEDGPDLLVLPEMFSFQGGSETGKRAAAEPVPQGDTCQSLQEIAALHRVIVHGGSFFELDPATGRIFNTTVTFDRDGSLLAQYRKIHRFDVTTPDGTAYRESDLISAGQEVVTYSAEDVTVGCTICYDLRFGELFRMLAARGAMLIAVPSAFTHRTGRDHWKVLLRARAIETQCYIAAAAQCGSFPSSPRERRNWGHAMILDPWGEVMVELGEETGFATAEIDREQIAETRQRMPVASHRVLEG